MKVIGTGTTSSLGAPRRAGRTDRRSDDFARHLDGAVDGMSEPQPVESLSPLSAIEAMFAAQSVDPDEAGRKQAIQRGEDMLDRLEDIRVGLLLGTIPADRLSRLADMVRTQRDTVNDPGLAAILDEIELRAQVELAKLGRD